MAKKYAFLFPGQGAQTPGMIKDVCSAYPNAQKIIDDISSIAGVDMPKLLWNTEKSVLNRSDNSQLVMTASSLAIVSVLALKGVLPSAVMGFSLGEFPAMCAAKVLSFEDAIKVVKRRGHIMQEVCENIARESGGNAPGMAAVIGLEPEKVIEIAESCTEVYAANMNSKRQTVISATFKGMKEAEEKFKAAGARRFIRLAVAGPFHSPLMQKAADDFKKAIEDITFHDPKIALFSNVTGKRVASGVEAKTSAVLHLTNPVKWTDEETALSDFMAEDAESEWKVFETGPGSVLSGLWRDSDFSGTWKSVPINTTESIESLTSPVL